MKLSQEQIGLICRLIDEKLLKHELMNEIKSKADQNSLGLQEKSFISVDNINQQINLTIKALVKTK